ncbi:hypothetical protein ACTG9Q_15645 [Actinokineospora sp. 24-640]
MPDAGKRDETDPPLSVHGEVRGPTQVELVAVLSGGPWKVHIGHGDDIVVRGSRFDMTVYASSTAPATNSYLLSAAFSDNSSAAHATARVLADLLVRAGLRCDLELDPPVPVEGRAHQEKTRPR